MRLRFRGDRDAQAGARRAIAAVDSRREPLLRALAEQFFKGESQIFRTYGSIIGNRWAPLAESTARSRLRLAAKFGLSIGPRDPRLVLFGDMRRAVTSEGPATKILVQGGKIAVVIDQTAINRHNRATGGPTGLTKKGRPRKVRGSKGRYPDNIIDLHEEGGAHRPPRQVVGVPPGVQRSMNALVKRFFDGAADELLGRG